MAGLLTPDRLLRALAKYDFEDRDEQAIREEWLYPLLSLLGYGIGTSNRVDMPFKVEMRPPVRMLGSHRLEVDYLPTVHNVGLWIIEAKRPDEDLFSERHLGQAWSYATHPAVDVPFMALANGRDFRVFDLTLEKWDESILDIDHAELPNRFAELESVLGSRRVAEFVRQRQLRHLKSALEAQVDEDALSQTLSQVKALVESARPAVRQNRARVLAEAWEEWRADQDTVDREIGVWGMAFRANSVNVVVGGEVDTCVELIKSRPVEERAGAFDEMLSAANVGGATRQTFSLRVLRLATALRLVGVEGCDEVARSTAEEIARDGAKRFPDDEVAAAAHELEMVLAAFISRVLLTGGVEPARRAEERARATMDLESFLRRNILEGLDAPAQLMRSVDLLFRQVWVAFEPWTAEGLRGAADELRGAMDRLPPQVEPLEIGQIGNPDYQMHLRFDPLQPGIRNVVRDVADPNVRPADESEGQERRDFANELLESYFSEGQ